MRISSTERCEFVLLGGYSMKRMFKFTALAMTLAMFIGSFGGCSSSSAVESPTATTTTTADANKELDIAVDYDNLSSIEEVSESSEVGAGPLYVSGQKAGKLNALCYYDIADNTPDTAKLFAERFGGTVESTICGSLEYFEKLSILVMSGDSPDLVRYDWMAVPWATSKNMYTALDDWLNIDSPLWEDEKEVIEAFNYGGKHYYFPSAIQSNFAIIYNRLLLDEAGLDDPMELYFNGEWTWDVFEDMLREWKYLGDDYRPFTGGSWTAMMFANSTGTKVIDMNGTDIINNMKSVNVQRTMDWLADLKKEGYIGDGYVDPAEAFRDGKLLFLGMGLTWGFESAQKSLFQQGTPYDFCAVPIPRDPKADKYYMSGDSFGYMVPNGAKNIQGGVSWILASRTYESDPEICAEKRAKMMSTDPVYYPKCPECKYNFVDNNCDELTTCPECSSARKEKFKAYYSEDQLRVIDDMLSGDKITLLFDNSNGFSNELSEIFIVGEDSVFDGPIYYGSSYTQLRENNYNAVEAYLEPFRAAIAEANAD